MNDKATFEWKCPKWPLPVQSIKIGCKAEHMKKSNVLEFISFSSWVQIIRFPTYVILPLVFCLVTFLEKFD